MLETRTLRQLKVIHVLKDKSLGTYTCLDLNLPSTVDPAEIGLQIQEWVQGHQDLDYVLPAAASEFWARFASGDLVDNTRISLPTPRGSAFFLVREG